MISHAEFNSPFYRYIIYGYQWNDQTTMDYVKYQSKTFQDTDAMLLHSSDVIVTLVQDDRNSKVWQFTERQYCNENIFAQFQSPTSRSKFGTKR